MKKEAKRAANFRFDREHREAQRRLAERRGTTSTAVLEGLISEASEKELQPSASSG